jgi:hypothetical protein
VDHAAELGGKTRGGKPGKGLVHDRNRADLFFGEFVGPLKVVNVYFTGIRRGPDVLRLRVSGVYRGEKLINFILRQNLCHSTLPGKKFSSDQKHLFNKNWSLDQNQRF